MNNRMKRVDVLLKQEISKLLQEEFAEQFGIISVSYVNTAPDLKTTKIEISVLNTDEIKKVINILNEKSAKLRRILGSRVRLKNMPELEFIIDTGVDKVKKIDELLDKIEKEKI